MSDRIYMPTLSHWEYRNPWTGSVGNARFHALARKDEDIIDVTLWVGPMSREFSTPVSTNELPLSEEGLSKLEQWLVTQSTAINNQ